MLRSLGLITVREHDRFVGRLCEIHGAVCRAHRDEIAELKGQKQRLRDELAKLRGQYNELVVRTTVEG